MHAKIIHEGLRFVLEQDHFEFMNELIVKSFIADFLWTRNG